MRDKEAIDLERKNLARNLEKHAKLVDALKESENKLTQQIVMFPELSLPNHQANRCLTDYRAENYIGPRTDLFTA